MRIFKALRSQLNRFGLGCMRYSTELSLCDIRNNYISQSSGIDFLKEINPEDAHRALGLIGISKGQIHQDIFTLVLCDFKKDGYFVEFGATNGIAGSNTWLLEKKFQWKGICAEPAKQWQEQLLANRDCHVSTKCVWVESNKKLLFNEVDDAGFSTIDSFSGADHHAKKRKGGTKYPVETISLNDLLHQSDAPRKIDYLSIDTEGSEFDILSAFDFNTWEIAIITVEHNYTPHRAKVLKLLETKGFRRVLTDLSQFDDWYVSNELVAKVSDKFWRANGL